jgi:hypothetical protein
VKAISIRSALQYAGGLLVVIGFVVLLSFIFSFLGTIFCAALAGMMLGTSRQTRPLALPVSLIFPAVILLLLRTMHTELSSGQIHFVSLLCFAAFWLTFVLALLVVGLERKQQARNASPDRGITQPAQSRPDLDQSSTLPTAGLEQPAIRLPDRLNLEVLQGRWRCESSGNGAEQRNKVILIERTGLVLTVADGKGELSFQGKAEINLSESNGGQKLVLSQPV